MSNKKKKKSKNNSMSLHNQMKKSKTTRESRTKKSTTPRSPPKYGKTGGNVPSLGSKTITFIGDSSKTSPKSGVLRFDSPVLCYNPSTGVSSTANSAFQLQFAPNNNNNNPKNTDYTLSRAKSSVPVSPQSFDPLLINSSNTQKHIVFAQLKRKRKGGHQQSNGAASRPTFQFKIGMQVGVALGDCFLQLQKLENSMDQLRNVSEDITDVMQCIEQLGGAANLRKRSGSKDTKKTQQNMEEEDPIQEVHVLNDNLYKWQKDAQKRMKSVSVTVAQLQRKLEDLDEYHAQAQAQQQQIGNKTRSEVDKAMETIQVLQAEVQKAKLELTQKNVQMQKLKKTTSEGNYTDVVKAKLAKLEAKEQELDGDAEIIAKQSEELRKESERLLTERDEVRKQKENWQKMIDEVKDQKGKLEKREGELQANHKKLLELHETLSEEKKKLHKKAKKIKAREKRLNALRAAQTSAYQPQHQYQIPSSNGSDYAESELTYFSDGDTEIASVNSISDDESQDNYHKAQLKAKEEQKERTCTQNPSQVEAFLAKLGL
eukprot:474370_1